MARFVVSYDLSKPDRDYPAVHEVLRSFDSIKALESVWFVWSNLSKDVIRDEIMAVMDANDLLMVADMGWVASTALKPGVEAWLQSHPANRSAA